MKFGIPATKDEWEQLSETQREEVIEHIDPSALEVLDVNDNYVQNIDDSFSDVIDASQNQVDISTQVDYVDPNTIDGGEGVTGDDLFFA